MSSSLSSEGKIIQGRGICLIHHETPIAYSMAFQSLELDGKEAAFGPFATHGFGVNYNTSTCVREVFCIPFNSSIQLYRANNGYGEVYCYAVFLEQ